MRGINYNLFIKNQTKMSGGNTQTSQTDTNSIHLGGVIKNGGGISIGGSLGNQGTKFDDNSTATGPQTGLDFDIKGMPMMLINLDNVQDDLLMNLYLNEDDEGTVMDEEFMADLMNLRSRKSKGKKRSSKKAPKKVNKSSKKSVKKVDSEKEAWASYDKAMNKIYAKDAKAAGKTDKKSTKKSKKSKKSSKHMLI